MPPPTWMPCLTHQTQVHKTVCVRSPKWRFHSGRKPSRHHAPTQHHRESCWAQRWPSCSHRRRPCFRARRLLLQLERRAGATQSHWHPAAAAPHCSSALTWQWEACYLGLDRCRRGHQALPTSARPLNRFWTGQLPSRSYEKIGIRMRASTRKDEPAISMLPERSWAAWRRNEETQPSQWPRSRRCTA